MKILSFFLLIMTIAILSACGTVDKLASKADAKEVFVLNGNGDVTLIDTNKGKVVPPCDATDRKGYKECRIPFDLDTVKEDSNELKKQLESNCKSKDCKVISVKSVLIIDHPGSTCRLIYDRATGHTFQICR